MSSNINTNAATQSANPSELNRRPHLLVITGILLIQAVAFAVLSGIVANNKNRDPVKWGIIGLLFGLFGFIAVIAVSTVKNEKKCPACAEHIKVEARVCKHCGYEFSDEEVERRIAEDSEDSNREKAFSYKEIDAYGHISNVFSFLVSVSVSILGISSIYSTFSNPNPSNLTLYVNLISGLVFFLAGISFAYSLSKVYNNSAFGIYSITLSSPFILSLFLLYGIYSLYMSFKLTYFSPTRILIYLSLAFMSISVYYSQKISYKVVESNNITKEYAKNGFDKKVFGLADSIKLFRINEVVFYTTLAIYLITPFVKYITS